MALDGLGSWGNNSIGKRSALAIGSLKNTTYFSLVGKLNGLRPAGGGDEVGVELIVSMTVSDFYSLHRDYQMRIGLHTRNSKGDPLLALSAAFSLLENDKVGVVLSAQTSILEAKFLAEFANQTKIPVISISAPFGSFAEVKGIVAFIE
ncbi:hypothetical protein Goshw_010961 [Gossypium schwendimanii]|uniref:Receptor ligand binding region domain-containing protein n=1 Tax=Gossypium schwendimanii TaxID=34291 RepID=A0A7J9KKU8_GOSSC|nr:hypothetical protein [Gossypium schwendimanii]